jgi:hypothetical protein
MESSKPFVTMSELNRITMWAAPGNALYDAAADAFGEQVSKSQNLTLLTRVADCTHHA